ncbi:blast:KAT8 regulatory NSL complex subunit 3 [Drosophila guanche]|nr:blast:KAT8 regulatory NSL complex subunit 3 [Drosophila guanche]
MEHSYIRDVPRNEVSNGLALTRHILVNHPPQCTNCHTYPQQEQEPEQTHAPPYDEISAKESMNECARISKYVKNVNSDEQDWVARINQSTWSPIQKTLFDRVSSILDMDQLARLANDKRQHEAVHRRVSVDKSASRMRRALGSVAWDQRITQWLHTLLMQSLPPSYMASYLDMMQTLKTKLPTLMDKLLFSRPLSNNQELLAPVMKKRWEPIILPKNRQLPHNAIMVVLSNMPASSHVPERMSKWYRSLATICQVVQITLPNTNNRIANQNLDQVAEVIVCLTRVRINELRAENPTRGIILVGFNAGASLALQVALSESLACVVCMGFAYNTLRGPRGAPDDRILDIKAPILFVIGQNSARSSQEEMESLRERMQSETSLVVVGSADDALRVPKSKRRIEGVTQSMVDAMVVDEIYEFVNKTLMDPPGPRVPTALPSQGIQRGQYKVQGVAYDKGGVGNQQNRKRKVDGGLDESGMPNAKSKFVPHNDSLDSDDAATATGSGSLTGVAAGLLIPKVTASGAGGAIKSLPTTVNLAAGTKIKMIPSNQFVQLKSLTPQSKLINYTMNKPTTAATIGSIVKTLPSSTAGGQQYFTLKTPTGQTTKFVATASPVGAATSTGGAAPPQQKYTVFKNASGMTMLQLNKNQSGNVDLSSIIDMPIVFADNEGNIPEGQKDPKIVPATPGRNSNSKSPIIISQKIIKDSAKPNSSPLVTKVGNNIVLNKGIQQLFTNPQGGTTTTIGGHNKVVILNRNQMKPMGNMVTPGQRLPIRIVSSTPKGASVNSSSPGSTLVLDPATGSLKPMNVQAIKSATTASTLPSGTLRHTGNISVGNKTYPQFQVINSGSPGTQQKSTTVAGDGKMPIGNVSIKSGTGIKQVPVLMLANRTSAGSSPASTTPGGAAVRRVVNISSMAKLSPSQATSDSKVVKLQPTSLSISKQSQK